MKDKYILGINGWYSKSHDASACIIKNGKILAMAEEERFIRKKHAYDSLPIFSTLWCLNEVGIELDEIDKVAIGWDYLQFYNITEKKRIIRDISSILFPRKYFRYSKNPKIEFVPHHVAHAASSYFLSGFKEASILIVDGQGEHESVTFAIGRGNEIQILDSFPIDDSLGYFYEAISEFIGFGHHDAGKTMGLAPYGEPKFEFNQFLLSEKGYNLKLKIGKVKDSKHETVSTAWKQELNKMFGIQKNTTSLFRPFYGDVYRNVKLHQLQKDIAASAQNTLENVLLHLAKVLVSKTAIKNLCLSGGVALNCSSNTLIARSGFINELFIPPFVNDGGVSLGAALFVGGISSNVQFESPYLGPSFKDDSIEKMLKKINLNYRYYDDIEEKTAGLLSQGKIVSWFQGRMEVGPRALGNRSILAHPGITGINDKVNLAKGRELWRPLSPSILDTEDKYYLENSFPSPFMLHVFTVLPDIQKRIPAVSHVDGSTRPQMVSNSTNPRYYSLIREFKKKTGFSLLLNTSFNGSKEPIVCTPLDAIVSFFTNSTDYLVLGNFLIGK